MRILPSGFAAHIESGATTLCHAWKLVRRDGVIFGFTDHDRDLNFGGVIYAAQTGLEAADVSSTLGFAISGSEVSGALQAAGLTEDDIQAGLYDDARLETWLVNWQQVNERLLLDVSAIGEIRRLDQAFIAETRGLMHRLDQEKGRLYTAGCSADLGDARCGVSLINTLYSGAGVVTATDDSLTLTSAGFSSFAAEWFQGGTLIFSSGANAGLTCEVKAHRLSGASTMFDLWQRTPYPIAVGDSFTVRAGCDKSFETCKVKFNNSLNFQGFPHLPGNDFIIRMPVQGEAGLDGGSLFK
jgi:uncharacterized phage protein (TIGR02218 family)